MLRQIGRELAVCLVALSGLLLGSVAVAATETLTAERPNILVVMVDDMGYSDPGCFGGEVQTPNIDRLAAQGVRLTQFYNCSRCCQTRASLLTGAYPMRIGMKEFGRTMDTSVPTLAENLRDGGYSTSLVGKWHLSELPQTKDEAKRIRWMNHELDLDIPFGDIDSYPTRRGFEKFYGIVWGVVNHFDPFSLTEGEEPVQAVSEDFHMTDAISERAVKDLQEFSTTNKPFFLYVAYTAPHWPIHAREQDIAKYRGRYDAGWESLRNERFERQKKMGLFDEAMPLGKLSGHSKNWDSISVKDREYLAEKMAVHAAMVDHVDQGIGKIIEQLRSSGQLDNTIIFFFSDNGASPEIPGGPGYDRYSGTRDGRKALREEALRNDPRGLRKLGTDESYTGIGPSWASAANTPLRFWKMESYEGGCRTPMVIHWPKGIKAPVGRLIRDVGHVIDIAPTCYELAGVEPHQDTLQDGISLAPLLAGKKLDSGRTLYFQHGDGAGVRKQQWKASKQHGRDWQLFNIETDPGETKDLYDSKPEVLHSIVNDWKVWFAE